MILVMADGDEDEEEQRQNDQGVTVTGCMIVYKIVSSNIPFLYQVITILNCQYGTNHTP